MFGILNGANYEYYIFPSGLREIDNVYLGRSINFLYCIAVQLTTLHLHKVLVSHTLYLWPLFCPLGNEKNFYHRATNCLTFGDIADNSCATKPTGEFYWVTSWFLLVDVVLLSGKRCRKNTLLLQCLDSKWIAAFLFFQLVFSLILQRQAHATVMDTAVILLGSVYFHHTENVTVIICLITHFISWIMLSFCRRDF